MFSSLYRFTWVDHGSLVWASSSALSALGTLLTPEAFVLHWLGVPMPMMLASFAGGSCALSFLPRMGPMRGVSTIFVCTVSSAYTAPMVSWALSLPPNLHIGVAFLLSLFAQSLIGAMFTQLPEVFGKTLNAIVDRIRGV